MCVAQQINGSSELRKFASWAFYISAQEADATATPSVQMRKWELTKLNLAEKAS